MLSVEAVGSLEHIVIRIPYGPIYDRQRCLHRDYYDVATTRSLSINFAKNEISVYQIC